MLAVSLLQASCNVSTLHCLAEPRINASNQVQLNMIKYAIAKVDYLIKDKIHLITLRDKDKI